MSIIVQICGKNLYFSVCLAICYQPTLVAWQLYLVGSAIWSIFIARRYAKRDTYRRHVSVRPSVCLCVSVILRYCTKTAKRRITQIMPHDRPSWNSSFQMGCFVVAEFLLTSASRGPSAIADPLVQTGGRPPLDFLYLEILISCKLLRINVCHSTKFYHSR